MPLNLRVPLPGPLVYISRVGGDGTGALAVVLLVVGLLVWNGLLWVWGHPWVLLVIPFVIGWRWLARRNDRKLERCESTHVRHGSTERSGS